MKITFILYILAISICAIYRPKSKIVNFILLFTIWTLFVFSFDNYDRFYYERMFDNSTIKGATGYEMLFIESMALFKKLGFDFYEYRYFSGAITVLLTNLAIWKYCRFPNLVLVLYLFSQALVNACLMRHAIAFGLALIYLPLLFYSIVEKKKTLLYISIGLLFITPFIHSAFWVFFLFIPYVYYIERKPRIANIIIWAIVVFVIFVVFRGITGSILSNLSMREGAYEKIVNASGANLNGIIYNILKYLFNFSPVLLMFYYKKKHEIGLKDIPNSPLVKTFNENIVYINLFFLFMLTAQYFSVLFARLFGLQLIMNYIYVANILFQNKRMRSIFIPFLILHSIIFVCLRFFYESPTSYEDIWIMHLQTNLFIQIF